MEILIFRLQHYHSNNTWGQFEQTKGQILLQYVILYLSSVNTLGPSLVTNKYFIWIKNLHLGFGKRVRTRPSFIQFRWKIFKAYFSIELRKWNNFYISIYFSSHSHYLTLPPYCNLLLQERKRKVSFNCTGAKVWTSSWLIGRRGSRTNTTDSRLWKIEFYLWELWCPAECRGCWWPHRCSCRTSSSPQWSASGTRSGSSGSSAPCQSQTSWQSLCTRSPK